MSQLTFRGCSHFLSFPDFPNSIGLLFILISTNVGDLQPSRSIRSFGLVILGLGKG